MREPKPIKIPRRKFETSGWRTITIAEGSVVFPNGRNCRFNVRLQAAAGEEGDITLIAEDINRPEGKAKMIKLRRKCRI